MPSRRSASRAPGPLFSIFLATLIIPESVYLVPNFIIVTRLGWYDSLAALTVPFMASAFSIFLLRQFFAQIPNELLESARIDGAGHLRSLFSIVTPAFGGSPVHRWRSSRSSGPGTLSSGPSWRPAPRDGGPSPWD